LYDSNICSTVGILGSGSGRGRDLEDWAAEDQLAYELTCLDLADGWVDSDRHVLPDGLEEMVPDPFLAVVVSAVMSPG
jgi:hypothetical protein